MKLGWYVQARKLDVASVRFRCFHMAAALQSQGVDSIILDDAASMIAALPELDAIIIVKRMDSSVIDIASAAKDGRKAVLMDFCDDVLAAEYRPNARELNRAVFRGVLPMLDAIVTTGPGMATRLREYGYTLPPILEIPDIAETRQVLLEMAKFGNTMEASSPPLIEWPPSKPTLSEGERALAKLTERRTLAQKIIRAVRHPLWTMDRLHQVLTDRISVPNRNRLLLTTEKTLRTFLGTANAFARKLLKRPADTFGDVNVNSGRPTVGKTDAARRKAKVDNRPRIVWFGNHGAPHSTFGMLSLLPVAEALRKAYAQRPFVIELVSNNREKFDVFITQLGVPCVYVPWTLEGVYEAIDRATIALVTSGDDSFCDVKSANRALQALGCGKPVVAPMAVSLAPLSDFVLLGDVDEGLVRYLDNPDLREAHVAKALSSIARDYSFAAVAKAYVTALNDAIAAAMERPAIARVGQPSKRLLFLLDLAQDLTVVQPLLLEAHSRGVETLVLTTPRAGRKTPRLADFLVREKLIPTMVTEEDLARGDARWLRAADTVVMAAESSLPPHRIAHALAGLARRHSVAAVSLQHGLEVQGLTKSSDQIIRFNSDVIFTWSAPSKLPDWLDADIRRRCVGLGRSWRHPLVPIEATEDFIAVFENLHWDRYSREYRKAFVDDLLQLADTLKDRRFVVHPHPAGLWFRKHGPQDLPANVTLAHGDGMQILAASTCVITTPSTIALDAVQIGRPVAITKYDSDNVATYDPLQTLSESSDWLRFISKPSSPEGRSAQQVFLDRVCLPGDATANILDAILSGPGA